MDEYSFGCPKKCKRCASFAEGKLRLVPAFFKEGSGLRLMLIGQDPTIRQEPDRVKHALMLDDPNSQLSRWLRKEVFGESNLHSSTLYATNLVKCSFEKLPSAAPQGAVGFLEPYFDNCKDHLLEEISKFRPTLVLTLGEPAHKLFITILDNRHDYAEDMKDAFTGRFVRAELRGTEFDYSPCLHITTFRLAETYGDSLKNFERGLEAYFKESGQGLAK